MMQQGDEEQWPPEEHISRRDDQEHAHTTDALTLHPSQVTSKATPAAQRQVVTGWWTAMTFW